MRHALILMALFLMAMAEGAQSPAIAQTHPQICPNGSIIMPPEICPSIAAFCPDGTKAPFRIEQTQGGKDALAKYCASIGAGVTPTPSTPAPAPTPTPAPADTAGQFAQCKDGTTIPPATRAKGRSAMTSYCSGHGGLKGAVTTTR